MAARSPVTTIGQTGVVPRGYIPAAYRPGGTYVAAASTLTSGAMTSIPIHSLKAHCFYFSGVSDGDTFDASSSPPAPRGIVQAAVKGDDPGDCHISVRVLSPSSIQFNTVGTDACWLLVFTRA